MHYLFSRPDSLAEKAKQILEKAAEKEMGLEEEVDTDAAYELKLFADNDEDLYKRSAVPVMQNLTRKFKKGIYDHELAKKLWKYHADRAAKAYGKEHGNDDGFAIFSPAIRKEVAAEFADAWLAELEAGNLHEEFSSDELKVLKEIGFKEAPVGKSTYDSSKGVKVLYGLPLRGGKWLPDAWVGQYDNGRYFVSGLEGTMDFNNSAGIIYHLGQAHLKKAALGESVVEESVFRESNKSDEIKSLEDLIKNPDPARVKQYGGGTKYVDMLRAKLDKLTNESSNEVDLFDEYEESVEIQEGKVSSLVWGVFAQTLLSKIEPKDEEKARELLKIWGSWKDKFTDKDIADLIDKLKTPPKPEDGYFLYTIDEIGKIAAAYDEPKADWYKKKLARLGPKENIEISVQKMLDAEDREDGKFHSTSDMTTAFDENPEGSTSQLGDGVLELDGFNAAGWQHLDGKYAVRVGGGYKIYTDLEAAKAYAEDDF